MSKSYKIGYLNRNFTYPSAFVEQNVLIFLILHNYIFIAQHHNIFIFPFFFLLSIIHRWGSPFICTSIAKLLMMIKPPFFPYPYLPLTSSPTIISVMINWLILWLMRKSIPFPFGSCGRSSWLPFLPAMGEAGEVAGLHFLPATGSTQTFQWPPSAFVQPFSA